MYMRVGWGLGSIELQAVEAGGAVGGGGRERPLLVVQGRSAGYRQPVGWGCQVGGAVQGGEVGVEVPGPGQGEGSGGERGSEANGVGVEQDRAGAIGAEGAFDAGVVD